MIVFVWLHMFRVFLTGSYKPPREFNWIVGVLLLVLTLIAELHRLSAALGSACDLGGHGRFEHGARDAVIGLRRSVRRVCRRQSDLRCARVPIRRRRDRAAYLIAILHPALHLHSSGRQHLDGGAFLAHSPRRFLRSFAYKQFT